MPGRNYSFSGRRPRTSLVTRSRRRWALRGLLALGVGVLGAISLSNTFANVIVRASPASAFALAPTDGRVVAALAQERFATAPDSSPSSEQARLARRALQLDATAVDALT